MAKAKNDYQIIDFDAKGRVTSWDVNTDPFGHGSIGEFTRFQMNFDNKRGTSTLLESTRSEYETLLHRYDKNNVEIEKIGELAKAGHYGETGRIKFEYIPGTEKVKSVSMLNGLGDVEEVLHNPSESMLTNIYLKYKVR